MGQPPEGVIGLRIGENMMTIESQTAERQVKKSHVYGIDDTNV